MTVNEQQLLDDGFIIIREVIPPERLDELRKSFDVLVERQKDIWAHESKEGDPPGGVWETHPQPRLVFNNLVDETTANTVEFCLHENTLGVSQQLFRGPEAAITAMFFMCNPVRDHSPEQYKNQAPDFFSWHRDINPGRETPLSGLQADFLENGAGTVQWNIPLYDDDVLWVVPGSHRRTNTEAENRQLLEDPRVPLPGSTPVELKAGDGVVYSNMILHWGSNYSTKLRRTIHLGYRSFGGPTYPYPNNKFYWDLEFTNHLPSAARASFERFAELQGRERDVIVSTFRAIIAKDAAAFRAGLAQLHPGENARMVALVLLCKLAERTYKLTSADIAALPPAERAGHLSEHPTSLHYRDALARHFSSQEGETLWQRFSTLDSKLQADTEQYTPGFQGKPSRYRFEEMPADFGVDDFVGSWEKGA